MAEDDKKIEDALEPATEQVEVERVGEAKKAEAEAIEALPKVEKAVNNGLQWLLDRQVIDTRGDWAELRPDIVPGGWAFQYANPHYPDLDDSAVVVMALDRSATLRQEQAHRDRPHRRYRPV